MRHRVSSLLLALATVVSLSSVAPLTRAADQDIRISSIGYVAGRAKRASIVGVKSDASAAAFSVKRESDGTTVMTGTVTPPVDSAETGESIGQADFTTIDDEGRYYVEVSGLGRSPGFAIGPSAFRPAFVASMLGFYGWRCGTAVSLTFANTTFAHAACHTDDAHTDYIGSPGRRDGTKGWHDAGDYGKYVVNAGVTVGSMLSAWEQFSPVLAQIALPIPEAGGSTPDYLDEIRWELEWLLTMQYSDTDARVSHKLTSISFDAVDGVWVPPEGDTQTRYYVPWGTAATADFVAILAKAARVYSPYDADFARRCLDAAKRSYAYLQANPNNVKADQSAFKTGGYETTDADDRLWAAAEMWETTGDAAALQDFETRAGKARQKVASDFDWGDVTNLGMYVYALSKRSGRSDAVLDAVEGATLSAADTLVANRAAHPYGRGLVKYYWGANGSVARSCMLLQTANLLSPKADYLDTCVDQIAWLFGRNYYNRSFVTGLGKDPPLHPHHRPSAADAVDAPWPGLLVGGGFPTAKDWVDEQANYEVNEVAINWNGALVYALAGFVPPSEPSSPSAEDAGPDARASRAVPKDARTDDADDSGTGGSATGGSAATGTNPIGAGGERSRGQIAGNGAGASGSAGGSQGSGSNSNDDDSAQSPKTSGCGCRTARPHWADGRASAIGAMIAVALLWTRKRRGD